MADLRIGLSGGDLVCTDAAPGGGTVRKPLGPEGVARLDAWARAYEAAVRTRQPDTLSSLGREIADFLNGGDLWLDRCIQRSVGPIALEIRASGRPDGGARALLDVPWEVLAPDGLLLAEDARRPFLVARRLGGTTEAEAPVHGDIAALFMAAEVEGQHVLDHEREEIAFLDATHGLGAHLAVEESGSLDGLRLRLKQSSRWDVLHLTGHGDLDKRGPFLALETPEGGLDRVDADRLCEALGDQGHLPGLVFLSACRTAEQADGDAGSLVQAMVQSGVPNVLGWDGSVQDDTAIRFAAEFYGELAGGRSVVHAAATARRAVLADHRANPERGGHWHLARVWLGPGGGGALCDPSCPTRPFRPRRDRVYLDKLGERVPVAPPERFVGRRRSIQAALRAWAGGAAGVLLQGMGNLGKSSLAERIANRLDGHDVVVVFDRYDAHSVFLGLVDALPEGVQQAALEAHEKAILDDPSALKRVLQEMVKGAFSGHGGTRPLLLIVDDLERCLAEPRRGEAATPFKTPEDAAVMASIVGAFRDAGGATKSRLLITSRYVFALSDARGHDLAACLAVVALPPMDEAQRTKQMRTAARLSGRERAPGDDPELDRLEGRIRAAAGGNPGLQEILTRPLLEIADRATALAAAEGAVRAVEGYLESGEVPEEESAAQEFFRRVSLRAFRERVTPTEARLFQAATLFSLPVPEAVLEAAGRAASVGEAGRALSRLLGLGLLDRHGGVQGGMDTGVNPLARPLAEALSPEDRVHLAKAVVGPLYSAWSDGEGDLPAHPRAVELARLALLAGGPPEIVNAAAGAGSAYLYHRAHMAEAAWGLVQEALALLERLDSPPALSLLRTGAACAGRLGDGAGQDALLARAASLAGGDPRTDAAVLFDRASRLLQGGDPAAAEALLRAALERFDVLGDELSRAVTMGTIADILTRRGETEEALRLWRIEILPIFDRLGDLRSRAVTMGRIADILTRRGETEEALRIRREEELPVYERLGDLRERAVTMGKIADILTMRGETEEALRIRREEELPVYERLGDVRSRAVTMGDIADILTRRGETEEALRIRREEQLPVYERLGDLRSRAVTMGKIADILTTRGETEEALRIYREEQLPVYERLGEVRSRAVTMGYIADILTMRGETEEALRLWRTEILPVFDRLGDLRSRVATLGKIAEILTTRGETEEALRIHLEDRLPVAQHLNDADSLAHIRYSCVMIRLKGDGLTEETAQTILEELGESFTLFLKLGRVDAIGAVGAVFGQVLAAVGATEEAAGVFDGAEAAFAKIGDTQGVADVRALREELGRGAS
ncbi:CHAT domain-containing protein [Rhodospirillum sp. A1_3_36]|uniref:CHAT domain-containing protein n=1 Tax=Rhodospirillum sp. A1_3_36 TaxID=3391666 RepID=UPI0039A47EED